MSRDEANSGWPTASPLTSPLADVAAEFPPHRASLLSLRPMLYLLTALVVAIIITVFAEPTGFLPTADVLAPLAVISVAIFFWHVRSVSSNVLRLVFVLLTLHGVVGYLSAGSILPFGMSGTLDDRAFSLSFAVIAAGLLAAIYAFQLAAPARGYLPRVDTARLVRLAKWMTVAAIVTILYFYN